MTILEAGLAELAGEGLGQQITKEAKELLAQIILPQEITRQTIEKYIRKAIQIHAWHHLKRLDKAILTLTRKLPKIKSPTLKTILQKIFLQIELHTTRGKALFYGIIISMRNTMHKLHELLKNIPRLLTIGLFYLNNPPIYRIYG